MKDIIGKEVTIIEPNKDEGGIWLVLRQGLIKDSVDIRQDNHTICDIKVSRLLATPKNIKSTCKCGNNFITSEIDGGKLCAVCCNKTQFN
jgi:hypothetical protein